MSEKKEKNEKITILLLGGYGNTGRLLTKLLLEYSKIDRLIIAGRNMERAYNLIQEIKSDDALKIQSNIQLQALQMDASDPAARLAAELRNHEVTLFVVASSSARHTANLAKAALEAKVDFMDVQYSRDKTRSLHLMKDDIEKAGCCFITDCGFHPGLPAALIRYMASKSSLGEKLQSAVVSSVIRIDWKNLPVDPSPETMQDFAAEFDGFSTSTYKDGAWAEKGFMNPRSVDFGHPFGSQPCFPIYLEELQELPALYPTLRETGFYIGSLNWVVDWLLSPLVMMSFKLRPNSPCVKRSMGRLLHWGLVKFSRPPYGTVLHAQVEDATGQRQAMSISHKDGYVLTALPVAATINQYLDTTTKLRKPGLWLQGTAVDPERLMKDMEEMGLVVQYK